VKNTNLGGVLGNPGNPNNTDTWARRGTHVRELDNDHTDNSAADSDYFGNLKKFERHDNMALPPSRDNKPPKAR
jgi:hypothetical protein